MAYSEQTLEEIREAVDIIDVIDQVHPLKKAGKEFTACCPFHDEKTPSFSVSPEEQVYYCFGGCDGGDVFTFYQAYHRVPFPEAVRELAAIGNVPLPEDKQTPSQEAETRDRAAALSVLEQAQQIYQKQLSGSPEVQELLMKRGVAVETAEAFGLGAASNEWRGLIDQLGGFENRKALADSGLAVLRAKTEKERGAFYDSFRNGLIFPVRDARGNTVSFAVRRISDQPSSSTQKQPPKYKNGKETIVFKKSQVIYGLYELKESRADASSITVTEGYMDVIAAHQAGFKATVGTMGTSVSPSILKTLYRHTDHLVFCFDGDKAGRQAAERALYATLPFLDDTQSASFVFLPEGEDIDSFLKAQGPEAYGAYLKNKVAPASEFILHLAKNGNKNLDSVEARGQFFANAKSLLDQMPPSSTKSVMMGRLEHLTGIRPTEYLPYSIDMQQGNYKGVDLGKLEVEVRDFIAQKIDAPAADIKVNWSMPEVGPMQGPVVPRIESKSVQKNVGAKMKEVGRILSLESTVSHGLTLARLLNSANNGSGDSQLMAKGLISKYLKDSNAFDVQCQLARQHLKSIREDISLIAPTMDKQATEQMSDWLTNVKRRTQLVGTLSDHLDSVTTQKIERHIQTMSDTCDAACEALASSRDQSPQIQNSGVQVQR